MRDLVTISPNLDALKNEFLQRCTLIAEAVRGRGGVIDSEFIRGLRSSFMIPLQKPRRAELEEELSLITDLSVVIDLVGQGWLVEVVGTKLELSFVRDAAADAAKDRIRRSHLLDRDAQLTESSVLHFIREMEKRRLTRTGWHSIFSLMRDGEDLSARLQSLGEDDPKLASENVRKIIRPYLQFVSAEAVCEYTGLRLNDIWRYFRHTWVNSYRSVPGRSMMILIRDAGAANHPVIGLAALGSSVVQSSVRDAWIGWDSDGATRRLSEMTPGRAKTWLFSQNARLIGEIFTKDLIRDGLLSRQELVHPKAETLERLSVEAERMIRQHRLYPTTAKHNGTEALSKKEWEKRAELPLFRSKRCKQLARLLKVRIGLRGIALVNRESRQSWAARLTETPVRAAVSQLIRAVKAERVGINMMDITVCGAIAPYNHLLGGKLVCMLLASPEVTSECARRYGEHVSIIASAMQGRAVVRDAHLALLCTTSLYGSALSQYSRVKVPAEIAGGHQGGCVEYRELGVSEGFGSFHFSKESLRLFDMVVGRAKHGRKVNSIFGEGVNPLMRKIRDAMSVLGLPAEQLLLHGNQRVVYGVCLAQNTKAFLSGFEARLRYTFPQKCLKEHSGEIASYWCDRWLMRRLAKPATLQDVASHRLTYPIRHGARVRLPSDDLLLDSVMFISP